MKKARILFVDDEPNILDGIKRELRKMKGRWELFFTNTPENALQLIEQHSFDIVVSNIKMPSMDGLTLLKKIKESHPTIIRVTLSGEVDKEKILKTSLIAHQHLSKPCSKASLVGTIQSLLKIRGILTNPKIKAIVSKLSRVPTLPSLYIKITEYMQKGDASLKKIGDIISQDPFMTAKILQIVNSSYFGYGGKIKSPQQAAVILGLETLKSIILGLGIFYGLQGEREKREMDSLWNHSIRCARIAEKIALRESNDIGFSEKAFLVGLLHDLGKVVIITNFFDLYKKIKDSSSPLDTERQELGCTHSEIGAYLLGLWGFEEEVIRAVNSHHKDCLIKDQGLSDILCFANLFSKRALQSEADLEDDHYLNSKGEILKRWISYIHEDETLEKMNE